MKDLFLSTLKEYCRVLGICYASLIGFSLFLFLTLLMDQTAYDEIIKICFQFFSTSILVAVFVVTPVFVTIFFNEYKKNKRKKAKQLNINKARRMN